MSASKEIMVVVVAIVLTGMYALLYIPDIATIAYGFVPIAAFIALINPEAKWKDFVMSWLVFLTCYRLWAALIIMPDAISFVLTVTVHFISIISLGFSLKTMKWIGYTTENEQVIRQFVLIQSVVFAIMMNIIRGVILVFSLENASYIAPGVVAIALMASLLIQIRNNTDIQSIRHIAITSITTLALISISIIATISYNWVLALVVSYIWVMQSTLFFLRFTETGNYRYRLTAAVFTTWVVASFVWPYFS